MPEISIIIPVLDEASGIVPCLMALQAWRARGHELIVVDGGSQDRTTELGRPLADQIVSAPRGRAIQMNTGAAASSGNLLVFLHADTRLPASAFDSLEQIGRKQQAAWGRFDVRHTGRKPIFRIIERAMNLRSRLTGIATGDQTLFVHRRLFEQIGHYPELALMEDIALSSRLRRISRPVCLRGPVITSSRRWEQDGVVRTVFRMWGLRLLFFFGMNTPALARHYRPVRDDA